MAIEAFENVPYDLPQPTAEEREAIFAHAIRAEAIGVGVENGNVVILLHVGEGLVKWTGTPSDAAGVALHLLNEAAAAIGGP